MYVLINKLFIGLLSGIVSASNHKKCVFLSNQICMIETTFINLQSRISLPSIYS